MSNYTNFRDLKSTQAILFLSIPVILYLVNGCKLEMSISDYADKIPLTFSYLLTLSGVLFFYDGYVDRRRWFNIVIGASLFGVVLFSNTDYPIIHYSFALIFFLGSIFNMIKFSSKKRRVFKIIISIFIIVAMLGHYVFDLYSLFFAEWIGMLPISLHYVFKLHNK